MSDVKGDKDAFYKYFDKFFEHLAEKRKMIKARDFIYVLLVILIFVVDFVFRRNINLFNIIFDAIFLFLVFLIVLFDIKETAKLTKLAEKALPQKRIFKIKSVRF